MAIGTCIGPPAFELLLHLLQHHRVLINRLIVVPTSKEELATPLQPHVFVLHYLRLLNRDVGLARLNVDIHINFDDIALACVVRHAHSMASQRSGPRSHASIECGARCANHGGTRLPLRHLLPATRHSLLRSFLEVSLVLGILFVESLINEVPVLLVFW